MSASAEEEFVGSVPGPRPKQPYALGQSCPLSSQLYSVELGLSDDRARTLLIGILTPKT